MRIEKFDWSKCQKQPLEVFYGKKVFFKMPQNSQETPVPEETPVNFSESLGTPLLQNNSGQLLLKCRHFNIEARDIDCIFIGLAKTLGRKESISSSSFYGDLLGC